MISEARLGAGLFFFLVAERWVLSLFGRLGAWRAIVMVPLSRSQFERKERSGNR